MFRLLVMLNYYGAMLLLLVAGIMKLWEPHTGDILMTLYQEKTLSAQTIFLIDRLQPWAELATGLFGLIGWRAELTARWAGGIYLFFGLLILYVSGGYLNLPLDCGCFGPGEGTPVYLLLLRNFSIAVLLFLFSASYRPWTLFYHLRKTS